MTKGFTLIELLVVVLIIGILAAIAVPQYRKSVEKSQAMEALIAVRTLAESYKRFQLENGTYPTAFDQLDVSLPLSAIGASAGGQAGFLPSKNWQILVYPSGVIAYRQDKNVNIFWRMTGGDMVCVTLNDVSDSLCRALGAVDFGVVPTSCGWNTATSCLRLSTPGKV